MAVQPSQLDNFSIQREASIGKLRFTETDDATIFVFAPACS